MPSPAQLVPLSPQLDSQSIYCQSPVTSLPRHSRGLDFSRASTNLHHSTLAEQSSPDLSPIITQKAMSIPTRKMSVGSMALDSPNIAAWPERSAVSSSVGSVNMLASDSGSDSSEDDASMGEEDEILTTPQVHKLHNPSATTPFTTQSFSSMWAGQSPATTSLLRTIRKSRLNKSSKRPKKSSSSASNSGYSSLASPRTTSPPPMKSIEGGYFGMKSRRESLALGTDGLNLSSGNDSGDEAAPQTPGVVRRPVTRRGNLLPKTQGFARIRAALLDEASPVDTEFRREAETIRQVRERDGSITIRPPTSPAFLPAESDGVPEEFTREIDLEATPHGKGLGVNFQLHANKNSAPNFWQRFETSAGTPPPSFSRQSSTMTSDATMDSPIVSNEPSRLRARAHSTASDMSDALGLQAPPTMNDDMHLKKFKRRREDDSDIATVKRRAVSPGMSTQNSPILTQSPHTRDNWGLPPERKNRDIPSASSDTSISSQIPPARSGSNGSITAGANSNPAPQGKKLGLQGMVDTNDGIMKMSIE